MTAQWQPGTTYIPGSIVVPTSTAAPGITALLNPSFASGNTTGWTANGGSPTWTASGGGYNGNKVTVVGGGIGTLRNNAVSPVSPGQTISAQAMARLTNAGGVDDLAAELALYWTDASHAFISQVEGANIHGVGGSWKQITVSGVAPANAAFVQLVLGANTGSHGGNIDFSNCTWNSNYNGPPAGLVYKATQAAPGKSAATEPVWPGNTTTPVTDNQVTWQGVIATQLVWTASAINKSGGTEPTWPTQPGGTVHDGTIDWEATVPVVTDPNCPHSKIVQIAASKVYAADNDIIRYSATVNPLDWSSPNDAGYLPYGLQTYGDNPAAAMGLYRSNLTIFSASGFQMWQVDEDPANTALMDALPIASTNNRALTPVANDLLFLSSKGVRSVGVSASGVNLQSGDVGMPIDPMVQQALALAAGNPDVRIMSTFVPADAQYWISFSNYPMVDITITGDMPDAQVGTPVAGAYHISGGTPPYVVTLNSGSLPPGIVLNSDGSYFGTYSVTGSYAWQIKVVDSIGTIALKGDGANVGTMTIAGDLGNGRSGFPVNYTYTSTGGAGAVTFSINAGALPTGLSISASGTVTGTRSAQGTFNFTVRASDVFGNHADLPDTSITSAPWAWTFVAQTALPRQASRLAPAYADSVTGLVVATDDASGGVFISSDGGHTWQAKATGFSVGDSVYCAGASKGSLIAFSSIGNGAKRSTDLGANWSTIGIGSVENAIYSPDAIFVFSPSLVKYSADGGATFVDCSGVPSGMNVGDSVMAFGGLYIAEWNTWVAPGQNTIYESVGLLPDIWTQVASGLARVGICAYSPTLDVAVITGSTGIYYRTRTGSWSLSVGPTATGGVCWVPSLQIFMAYGSGTSLYTSPDGINWTSQTAVGMSNGGYMIWSPVAGEILVTPNNVSPFNPYLSDI